MPVCPQPKPRRSGAWYRAATGAVCLAVVVAGLLVDGAGASATGHVTVRRTAKVHVHARESRTVTATQTVTVGGHTVRASARRRATVRAAGTARATARARATTHRAAAHRAAVRAHRVARHRALVRARRSAAERAVRLARARATRAARHDATAEATRLADQPPSSSTPPAQLTGGNPPVTTTVGVSDGGTTSSPPVSVGVSEGSGAPTASVGVDAGGTDVTAGAGVGPCGGQAPAKPAGGTWTCSFDDEFDGTAVDPAKWTVQETANSGFDQAGACYLDDPDNVSESSGLLHLTVRRVAPFTCASPQGAFTTSYTGGEVTTWNTFSQTYGRFEVRAKLPATTAKGLQETFWLWPVDDLKYGAWPSSGEIDFAEFYSQYAGWVIPYIHYYYDRSTVSWATNTNVVTALPAPSNQPGMNCRIDQSGFNTYTVTWLPNQITIQVNGQDCIIDNYQASNLSGAAPFDQPYFLALTQALGLTTNAPDASTPLPATTDVDYVRAWK